jgi:hypothetical protein
MITFHLTKSKLPGYIRFSLYKLYTCRCFRIYLEVVDIVFPLYMVSVPACLFTLTSMERNSPLTQTSPKNARNRSAASARCFETCFNIC